ncbi:MAG: sigma-70 family RNA polymerase sigma factor [Actinomycetia bacterium]|nr:sigma-70 family RNA polymerase sigma factor [Actinomycetes bacterium]
MNRLADAFDDAYRREWAFVLAATVRVAGSLDVAEECVQDAFVAAIGAWSEHGVPDNPGAWLTTAARRRALDQLRRDKTLRSKLPLLIELDANDPDPADIVEDSVVIDDRLRLVFTCCHPALSAETQAALTLRLVCGLSTPRIARAFLVSEATMAARITRGEKKIEVAQIPYVMPAESELPERLDTVLTVIHLFFTAGHTASSQDELVDSEVVGRSIDLARMLHALLQYESEVQGLLALLLLTDVRRQTRVDANGSLVLLKNQDRSPWDAAQIDEGRSLVALVLMSRPPGRFALQAAIAAVHAGAPSYEGTDWSELLGLYDVLLDVWPSPVVELNRAVVVAELRGPEAGLAIVDGIASAGQLDRYSYLPATRADLLRRLNRRDEAALSYKQAIVLVDNDVERAFLQDRLIEVQV